MAYSPSIVALRERIQSERKTDDLYLLPRHLRVVNISTKSKTTAE